MAVPVDVIARTYGLSHRAHGLARSRRETDDAGEPYPLLELELMQSWPK
ncbi:hypothetical protein [Adlercreutzia murintestinalis]|nr:hypothetical protein [Adlercreutzia murintestinalis]